MTSRFNFALTAAVSALALSTAACGGGNASEEAATEEAATAAAPPADTGAASAEGSVTVGGAAMYPSKTIVENAGESKDHTTLVAAVQAAGLAPTLSGPGPFTVFAPTNAAFEKLPAGTVDTLVEPANKAQLTTILTYHVVPGRLTAADLISRAAGGEATLKTVQGAELKVRPSGGGVQVVDAKGGTAMVTTADVMQSNGAIHVGDTVLRPQ